MTDVQNTKTGLPIGKQLFGGFNRDDVIKYVERLLSQVEAEHREADEGKQRYYDLMKNGQAFCDNLAVEARKNADALMKEAQQNADELLREANEQLLKIKDEREQLIIQTQIDLKHLANALNSQHQKSAQTYENMLRPLMALQHSLEGDNDAS